VILFISLSISDRPSACQNKSAILTRPECEHPPGIACLNRIRFVERDSRGASDLP
jgi:hypothetical protein